MHRANLTAILERWLGTHALWLATTLSILLAAGTLNDGFTFDDRVHRAIVQQSSPLLHGSPVDLFRTATGDKDQVGDLVEAGAFPWFTVPDLRVAFFRPLASLSHALDYRLWPDAAWLMHLQNILLYAALVALAGLVFRRLHRNAWPAGLAVLLFAVDETHAQAVGWIACRNALVSATFGTAALLGYLVAADPKNVREQRLAPVAAPLSFGIGLLGGELALGVLGFIAAHMLTLNPRSPRDRLVSLVPYAAVTAAWAIAYRALGYGVHGSGYYVDPIGDPAAFLFALWHNAPTLVVLTMGLPSVVTTWLAALPLWRTVVPLISIGLVVVVMGPLLLRDKLTRFHAFALVLTILPLAATLPQPRLLLLPTLCAAGLVARLLDVLVSHGASRGWRFTGISLCVVLLIAHGVVAPVLFPHEASSKSREAASADRAISNAPPSDGTTLMIVHAPHAFVGSHFLFAPNGPRKARLLHAGPGPIVVSRTAPNALTIHDAAGLLREPVSWLFHGLQHPMRVGERIALSDVAFEVVATTSAGRPTAIRCVFEPDASRAWVTWRDGRYVAFELPEVGQRTVVGR